MLRAIKRFLAAAQAETPAVPAHERRQLQLAVAVLVHEARRADYAEGDDDESATAERALAETFGLQPDITAARGQTVQLAPTTFDRDGQVVAYAWRQVSGQAVPLGNTTSPQLTFTVPKSFKAGDLVFEVTVTDNLGGKASDQVKVSVTR